MTIAAFPREPEHTSVRDWFNALGRTGHLPIYLGQHEDGWDLGVHCALAPVSYREKALSRPQWDLLHGPHGPGFSQGQNDDGEWETSYFRLSSGDIEPLVVEREFHGIRPNYRELSEEFRLFHNLYAAKDGRLLKFDDAGGESVAADLRPDAIEVATLLLRQYQAARQVDLLLFVESTVFFDSTSDRPPDVRWESDDFVGERYGAVIDKRAFTRFTATRVLRAPPIETAGIWPFEEDERHPDFIIGVDELGKPVRHSCDPDTLGNYFGKNPDEPHYLTPVHFRRDVLVKYYDRPDLYTVEDGYIRCQGLWGLRFDSDADQSVIVWLGDLGRDLPATEREYWLAFNVPPIGNISETTFRRAILGEFADAQSIDLRFRHSYPELNAGWVARFGWPLYIDPEPGDAHLLDSVRRPLHDTAAEFEEAVRNLTKVLIDSLNEGQLRAGLEPGPDDEKGISKFERWLAAKGYRDVERDIAFLRSLQRIRSTGAAHRKGTKYEAVLTGALGERRDGEAVLFLLDQAVRLLDGLSQFVKQVADR